jgi:hypothetical protein
MSTLTLTADAVSITVETLKADNAVLKKWKKAADILRSEGVTAEKLTNDSEYRSAFKTQVVLLSFTKLEQAIYAKPTTSLSDEEKVTKRFVTTELGSRLGKVARHVNKAEQEEAMTDDERGARKVADMATRLKKDLAVWIEKIEKAEAVTFSATQMIKHLKDASALIK